jgi:bifunctional non-homologous end joining protein LigD
MAEQLSLRLDPALPRLEDVRPMWPVPSDGPFDSPDHLFEPTWGGHRALALVGPAAMPGAGQVRLLDQDGADLVPVLPELAGLGVRVAARAAVLDGELVVVDGRGRSDPEALAARLDGSTGRPVAYLVFDLLHLDGRWLLNVPLEKRRALLRRVLRPGDEVVMVPAITGEGRALYEAVTAQGLGGVLARERRSPYLPGVRSQLWREVPARPGRAAGEADPAGDQPGGGVTPPAAGKDQPVGTGPVLAVFRRLPLDDESEEWAHLGEERENRREEPPGGQPPPDAGSGDTDPA